MGYDKYKVKEALEPEDMYDILEALGAEPEMKDNSIVCKTICHGGNSHKLYYYCEQKLFHCYTFISQILCSIVILGVSQQLLTFLS